MKSKYLRRVILGCLLALVIAIRFVPDGGEFYATFLYPYISFLLSLVSSVCPWSLEEIIVCGFVGWLILYPFVALICKWKGKLWGELEILLWIAVWFYLGWGCNYFRAPFHERMMIDPAEYSKENLQNFLQEYTDSLNTSYLPIACLDKEAVRDEIQKIYRKLPAGYGLTRPRTFQEPKKLLFNELYCQVGVLGFMGPFLAESQLNEELSDLEYPFIYAHELSHLLGISNEAEANFWAFVICTQSTNPQIRYSGYNGLLGYAAGNARQVLTEEEYFQWKESISQDVLSDEQDISNHWKRRKNPTLNSLQNTFYHLFLKSNNIKDGMQNYSQVIGMLISVQESQAEPLRRQGRGLSVRQ